MSTVASLGRCGISFIKDLGNAGSPDKVFLIEKNGKRQVLKILGVGVHGPRNYSEIDVPSRLYHPYIFTIEDVTDLRKCVKPGLGIVMDVAEKSLLDVVVNRSIGLDTRLKYFFQTAVGLWFMHSQGYLHLDIKVDNVLIHNDTARLADFGMARKVRDVSKGITTSVTSVTLTYRPPELLTGKPGPLTYNDKTDIWSLGHLLIAAVSGYTIFLSDYKKTSFNDVKRLIHDLWKNKDVRRARIETTLNKITYQKNAIRSLISRLLAYNPEDRPTLDEVIYNPLFEKFRPKTPLRSTSSSLPRCPITKGDDIYIRRILNFFRQEIPEKDVREFFLATDLFYRSSHHIGTSRTDREPVAIVVAAACIWIAITTISGYNIVLHRKLIDWIKSHTTHYVISSETLDEMIVPLVKRLGGSIYPDYLYEMCNGKNHIMMTLRYVIFNTECYNKVNLQKWRQTMIKKVGPGDGNLDVKIMDLPPVETLEPPIQNIVCPSPGSSRSLFSIPHSAGARSTATPASSTSTTPASSASSVPTSTPASSTSTTPASSVPTSASSALSSIAIRPSSTSALF